MSIIIPIAPDIKAKILEDIQKNGISMMDASKKHQVNYKTIHGWLSTKSKGTAVSWSEYQRVKHENQRLKEIVGELTLHQSRTKKI
jgi:transposase-like protein